MIFPHLGEYFQFLSILSILCHLWFGDRKGIQPVKNLDHLSPDILFHNSWKMKINGQAAKAS